MLGMFDAAAGLPDQVRTAVTSAQDLGGLPDPAGITNVLVLGMGGSGVAGDILTVTAGPFMAVPVVVVKHFIPPSYVDERSLVFAMSFSGDTVETLEATEMAASRGGHVVAVTSGGRLAELARGWGSPIVAVDPSIPAPRAALGAMAIPPLIVLEDMGLFPGATRWVLQGIDQLERRRDALTAPGGLTSELADRIGSTFPYVCGSGGVGRVAARRWKTQFNENAKLPAFNGELPEMTHNEVVGWGRHREITRDLFTMINLRHDHEHPAMQPVFEALAHQLGESVAAVTEVRAEGDGSVAQLLDLMYVADFVSIELAWRAGIDPGPIDAVDELKRRLGT